MDLEYRPFWNDATPPGADPASGDLIRIELNRAWLPYVTAACYQMLNTDIWRVDNEDDRILADKRARDLIVQLSAGVHTQPFYEDDDNVDGAPDTGAPWYDQISDWIIAAFLATTTTPAAAITYLETIPKLRLAFRTGDLGALVKVFIDDVEIWTGDTSDTASPLLETVLDVEAFALAYELGDPPHTMKIVHDGPPGGVDYDDPLFPKGKLEVELGDIRPRGAMLEIRQAGCVIEVSTDGVNWTTVYDPMTCIDGAIDTTIHEMLEDGILAPGGGVYPPEPRPDLGACSTVHVRMSARDRWLSPMPVQAGDTIRVFNARGGWNDGAVTWYCPNGKWYNLGECANNTEHHEETDPLNPGAFHMAIVGHIGATWFDPLTSAYVVAEGQALSNFTLQANDDPLSDNSGDIEFDVEVCNGQWSHTFNAASGLDAFSIYNAWGSWDGTKWVAIHRASPPGWVLYVGRVLPTNAQTTYLTAKGTGSNGNGADTVRLYTTGLFTGTVLAHNNFSNGIVFPANYHGGGWLCISPDDTLSVGGTITSVTVTGTGVNPFV